MTSNLRETPQGLRTMNLDLYEGRQPEVLYELAGDEKYMRTITNKFPNTKFQRTHDILSSKLE